MEVVKYSVSVFFVTVSVLLSGFFFTSSDLFSPWAFMVTFVFPPFTVGEFPSLLSACGELSVVSVLLSLLSVLSLSSACELSISELSSFG